MTPPPMSPEEPIRIDRRLALKWIMAAGAGAILLKGHSFGADGGSRPDAAASAGYGTDPDLMKAYKPGDYWPLVFTGAERRAAAVLCDIVIPADARSPSASSVGVTDFVDEWVSAPYPGNVKDRKTILAGLDWLDAESRKRYGAVFAAATAQQRETLCADISMEGAEDTGAGSASRFFKRFRDLVAVGYYTTPEGMKEIGYVGNVPLARFEGPPADVVEKLGLSDEVKW
jgi:hypothetical protein